MKLIRDTIKQMIKEVLTENQQSSMVLSEKSKKPKYERIIDALEGKSEGIDTVGLMSGQNPMAVSVSKDMNAEFKAQLENRINEMGLEFIRIGGIFAHNPEQSAMILNPTKDQMEVLNREFKQWGFVFGEKYPIDQERDFMIFKMYEIDYNNPMGYRMAPGSKDTATIRKQSDLAGQDTDFSVDPTSGKKFGLELYEQLIQQQINEVKNKKANSMIGAMKRDHKIKQLEAILRRVCE